MALINVNYFLVEHVIFLIWRPLASFRSPVPKKQRLWPQVVSSKPSHVGRVQMPFVFPGIPMWKVNCGKSIVQWLISALLGRLSVSSLYHSAGGPLCHPNRMVSRLLWPWLCPPVTMMLCPGNATGVVCVADLTGSSESKVFGIRDMKAWQSVLLFLSFLWCIINNYL